MDKGALERGEASLPLIKGMGIISPLLQRRGGRDFREGLRLSLTKLLPERGVIDNTLSPLLLVSSEGVIPFTTWGNAQISILVRLFLKLSHPGQAASFVISFCPFPAQIYQLEKRRKLDLVG